MGSGPAYAVKPHSPHVAARPSFSSAAAQRGQCFQPTRRITRRKNTAVSPRHVPATVTELTRCELLAELPGERLNELAKRMTREELPAGAAPVVEGEEGDRFYVVLSGVLAASKSEGEAPRVSSTPARTSERCRWQWACRARRP